MRHGMFGVFPFSRANELTLVSFIVY
jgi:hypothetical protein